MAGAVRPERAARLGDVIGAAGGEGGQGQLEGRGGGDQGRAGHRRQPALQGSLGEGPGQQARGAEAGQGPQQGRHHQRG